MPRTTARPVGRRASTGRAGRGRGAHRAPTAVPASSARHRRSARPALPARLSLPARFRAPVGVGALVLAVLAVVAAIVPRKAEQLPPSAGEALAGATASAAPVVPPTPVVPPSVAPTQPAAPAPTVAPVPDLPRPSVAPSRSTPRPNAGSTSRSAAPKPSTARPGTGGNAAVGVRAVSRSCTGSAQAPEPGDVICFDGSLGRPLKIDVGGTASAPIVYSGNGSTRVPGITSTADNVVIQGFVSDGADSTGIWASGRNVTVQDNTVTQVRHTDDDVDGIRFFGDGFRVLHNTVRDLEANDVGDAHVDCIQTYATSRPGSSDVVIQGNRCEGIRAQCLMAEGPGDDGGSGEGQSRGWLFDRNYCDSHAAAQSVALEDIQDVTISHNEMVGKATKAFALGQNSTGTVVTGNRIGPGYGREVGFDHDSARDGYRGPAAR